MGDAKRRKLFDPEYGKSHRVTESITHIIGIPDERLTEKYRDIKAHVCDTNFSGMTPDAVKKIIAAAKENKLDRYILVNPEVDDKAIPVSIDFVTDMVADLIDKKYLHSCAAQEFADILAQTDNPNNIKYLSIIHDEQNCEPLFMDLLKSTGSELFIFLTVYNLN